MDKLHPIVVMAHRNVPAWVLGIAFAAGYITAKEIADYKSWRSLGEGGLPANVGGWLVQSFWRLFRMHNPRLPHYTVEEKRGGYLGTLPLREGPRPKIAVHVLPHRILDQIPHPSFAIKVEDLFTQIQTTYAGQLVTQKSKLEKHTPALVLANPTPSTPSKEVGYEIAHYHPHDHTVHAILHTADAQKVIENGWGELHPLAGQKAPGIKLPKTFTMLYAPRDDHELAIFQQILEAAIHYHTGP